MTKGLEPVYISQPAPPSQGGVSAVWKTANLLFGVLTVISLILAIYSLHTAIGKKFHFSQTPIKMKYILHSIVLQIDYQFYFRKC